MFNFNFVAMAILQLLRPFLRRELNRKVRMIRNRVIIVTNQ